MAFAEILWMLVSYTCIFLISLLLAWTVYYDFTRTHIPAGMKEGGKLRAFNLIMNFSFGLNGGRQPPSHVITVAHQTVFLSTRAQAIEALAILQGPAVQGLFLEKLGVCSKIKFLRISFDGIPPMKDSKLLIKNMFFEHVPVRVYWPKTPSPAGNRRGLIYLHGGVGQIGSLRSYERVCRYLARESNSVVVNIGYRLSPEYRPPIQIQDCFTAIIYFLKNAKDYGVDPNSIVIGGDSSGATLAAGICQDLVSRTDLPRPRAQILLYPFLQALDFSLPSYQQNHSIPILFKKRAISLGLSYFYPKTDGVAGIMKNAHVPEKLRVKYKKWISADHVPDEFKVRGYVPAEPAPFSEELYQLCQPGFQSKYSPLIAEDEIIRQVPEAYILTCEYDVVRDDGLLYKKRLEDNGVRVTWHHLKDGFHGIAFVIDYGPLQFQGTQIAMENVIHFLHGLSK